MKHFIDHFSGRSKCTSQQTPNFETLVNHCAALHNNLFNLKSAIVPHMVRNFNLSIENVIYTI